MSSGAWHYRSPLGRFLPDSMDAERVKRDGWRQQGILVLSPADDRLDWMERKLLQQIGDRLYGQRGGSHG